LWIETWKKMCPRPTSVAHSIRPASPGTTNGVAMPAASMIEPPMMGRFTPTRSEDLPAYTARTSGKAAKRAARRPTWKGVAPRERAESDTSIFAPRMLTPCNNDNETAR
jgi:hypothetical protein